MPEMPIDQEFGRHVPGMPDPQENEDGTVTFNLPFDDENVTEMADGSAVVNLDDFSGPDETPDFYENLAESVNFLDLDSIGMRYLDLIENDKEAREKRDKQYEEGIRRTGLGDDAPGGAQFMGASKVVHPVMAEACVDFASSAIKELFPPDGPTRVQILGEVTEQKTERAERKRDYMNWQLTEQIEEFRDEQEQLLTQLPLGGSQYLKLWFDEKKRRPCAEFMPIDKVIVPFAAVNFYTAQRVTEVHTITEWEFEQRVKSGLYRDIDLVRATMEPEETHSEKANNKVEGRKWEDNVDGSRIIYHVYTWLELDDDKITKGESAPYILMIDELEGKIVGLYRNWENGDDTMTKLDWLVEYKFIPWRGAYAIGLPHLIGGLSAALTGALRALLDTAHVNNSLTMLKLKGARISGQSQQVEITQVTEIEGAPGVDDIRKIAMPMPFNPPSQVLFQLLGWLDGAAKGVVSTAEEKIADVNSNMPVGTTQALIEQGAKVFSAIHARLHASQQRVLGILARINRWYLDEQKRGDVVAELEISKEDFAKNTDVVPVSDPHIFSETQRMAQSQAVLALMSQYPQAFDQRAVLSRVMKQMKVPGVEELMPLAAKPDEMDAVDENSAMTLGKPAFAYPRQDHLAHIQTHLNFAMDPFLGSSALMAPTFIPFALEHIKQHMMLWYTSQAKSYALKDGAIKLPKYEDNPIAAQLDKSLAIASNHVQLDSKQVFAQVMPALQKLGEIAKQFKPEPPMEGEAIAVLKASMAETQRRAAADQAKQQIDMARMQHDASLADRKLSADIAMNAENNLTRERMKTAELSAEEAKLRKEQEESALALNRFSQRQLGRES